GRSGRRFRRGRGARARRRAASGRQRGTGGVQGDGSMRSWLVCALLLEKMRHLAAGAEEEQADAGGGESGDLGDLAVRVVFGVGEPGEVAVAGTELGEGGREGEPRVGLRGRVARG